MNELPLSLVDRLSDAHSVGGRTPGSSEHHHARQIRDAVRRDLELLLNTRWRCLSWPPSLDELEQSLVNYGIPDFTGASFRDAASQRQFRLILEKAIKFFEPRLTHVKVKLVDDLALPDRTLRFRIDAALLLATGSERIAFETSMDPSTAEFKVGSTRP